MTRLTIYCDLGNETIRFASEELKKSLFLMQNDLNITVAEKGPKGYCQKENTICLELLRDLDIPFKTNSSSKFDDEIYINISGGKGIIGGSNPRSILIGVYRFLTEAGCMWVRPGEDGEYIPLKNLAEISVDIHEEPSYRHRGICIEGANSYKNIADIIDWAPKVGFNAYFFQFKEAFTFFERWYLHKNNPLKQKEPFTVEMARGYVERAEKEIKKRDLIYHAVGHGWTCEPLNIPGLGWDKKEYKVNMEIVKFFAEVNGKRELWNGVPLNTNLCYSNPEVRNIITDSIVNYLQGKPEVDILHFWLADAKNNQCECANCNETLPSDYYVMMLNDLDEKLTLKDINTKIVFLIYVDLLWAPKKEVIKNTDRFILMFAPITRTYSLPYEIRGKLPETKPYVRNKLQFPRNVRENLSYLKDWEKVFKGDSFVFDYHYMWDHYLDPGYFQNVQILSEDIKSLENIGLNGYISCQTQRAFLPTGLGTYVMGKTLWDKELKFDELADTYFKGAYGGDWRECKEYMSKLSEFFDPPYMRNEKEIVCTEAAKRFSGICEFIDDFKTIINKNLDGKNYCHESSWNYLKYHADLCSLLSLALEARAQGNNKKANAIYKLIEKYAQEHEDEIQPVLDVYLYIDTIRRKMGFFP